MRYASGEEFLAAPRKAVTVFGMSGLGKTWLADRLRADSWFHYSADYRIGTRYMGEHIVDNFKREAMKVPLLRELLLSDSIYISSNLRFANLSPLSTYLGKPGAPAKGGIPFKEYVHRQQQHRAAEISAMLDVPQFIDKAHDIYGYAHFMCDASGSLCEVVDPQDADDPVLRTLTDHTLLVYLRGSNAHTRTLIERFDAAPKPMYYAPDFLAKSWDTFKRENGDLADDAVDPDAFIRWGYAQLLAYRQPVYEAIADHHGVTVDAAALAAAPDTTAILTLIASAIDAAGANAT